MTVTDEMPSAGRPETGATPRRPANGIVRRTIGELLITVGVLIVLFIVYTVYVTSLVTEREQRAANDELDRSWSSADRGHPKPAGGDEPRPVPGKAFARLYIPRFGADFRFAVLEGVGQAELAAGPGHYPDSALPGQAGNFALAGHRIGKGAPFNDLDELVACDPVVVETARTFYVYRVLPMADQVGGWARVRRDDPRCAKVPSLRTGADGGPYRDTAGRKLIPPDRTSAVAPVPYQPADILAPTQRQALLTLTTCHPEYGNSERMIIHAVLTDLVTKDANGDYPSVLRRIGEV